MAPKVARRLAGVPHGEAAAARVRRGRVRALLEVPVVTVLAVVIVIVLRALVVQPFYIPSESMVPQLRVNDKILVSRLSYHLHPVHRGDLIVFSEPPGAKVEGSVPHRGGGIAGLWRSVGQRLGLVPRTDQLVKRVIGLPGDTVEGRDDHVYIDGRLLLEPYLPPGDSTVPFPPQTVPPGTLWVMGDNRGNSEDSRFFGVIARRTVVGRAFVKVWPLDKISVL